MSTLSQFATSGLGTSLTVDTFIVTDLRFCSTYTPIKDNPLGTRVEGGFVIRRSASTAWIVSPRCSEVSRNWTLRNDAIDCAKLCTSCTGWFIPTIGQLQNPGYTCRTYWDSFSAAFYWSSTEVSATNAWSVNFTNGYLCYISGKTGALCVRAFRCVTY